jgi:hypothetical protein
VKQKSQKQKDLDVPKMIKKLYDLKFQMALYKGGGCKK